VLSTVHVVDDDASFQSAIRRRLELAGYAVQLYSTAEQFLDQRPIDKQSSYLLLDVQLPGLSGLGLQSRLREAGSKLPIVFISGHSEIPTTVSAIKAGAEDFLIKPVASGDLLLAIERAIARQDALQENQSELDLHRSRVASLTPRERQVGDLMVRGKLNKQIAFELGPTVRTIKAHRHRVMEKMHVESLAELVAIAERLDRQSVARTAGVSGL